MKSAAARPRGNSLGTGASVGVGDLRRNAPLVEFAGAYNPESIVKLIGIFRVFYNYCLAGKDGRTSAQRLGLARGTVSLEDIIYF